MYLALVSVSELEEVVVGAYIHLLINLKFFFVLFLFLFVLHFCSFFFLSDFSFKK